MTATIVSLLMAERSGPVELVVYCAGAVLDMEFESAASAKTAGTVILLIFGAAIFLTSYLGARAAAENTAGWKPAVIILGVLWATHLTFISLAICEAAPWLRVAPALLIGLLVAGMVVYTTAVVRCWSADSPPETQRPEHRNAGKARAAGVGTAVFILLLWVAGTLGLTFGVREYTQSLVCQQRLNSIHRAIINHTNENFDRYPNTLTVLEQREYLPQLPCCSKTTADEPYVYVCDFLRSRQLLGEYWDCISSSLNDLPDLYDSPSTATQPGARKKEAIAAHLQRLVYQFTTEDLIVSRSVPIVWDSRANHGPKNLMNVLFADGSVAMMTKEAFTALLRKRGEKDEHPLASLIRRGKLRQN
jgi:prepilin-type processing-associated H-X9-DG protein